MEEVMVSVVCAVYNHEKYLRKCLEGVIRQKTDFTFEVLIHDDASTDNSQEIIREYENKYPDIIKPIYQIENQYSKGVRITWDYQLTRAKGKYIAFCEGDDYWSDENKLQLQVNYIKNNKSVMSTHAVRFIYEDGRVSEQVRPNPIGTNRTYSSKEFIEILCKNGVLPFQTSSFLIRADILYEQIKSRETFIQICDVGDIALLMLAASKGSISYISREMSCYRMNSIGSWTMRTMFDLDRSIHHKEKIKDTFRAYGDYLNGEYSNLISYAIQRIEYEELVLRKEFKRIIKYPYKHFYMQEPVKTRLYWLLEFKYPGILCFYHRIKDILQKKKRKNEY